MRRGPDGRALMCAAGEGAPKVGLVDLVQPGGQAVEPGKVDGAPRRRLALQVLREEVVRNWQQTLSCGVPAVAYTLQGNLLFVALRHLEAPTYQVTYQCKTLFTALFFVTSLRVSLQYGSDLPFESAAFSPVAWVSCT